MIPCLKVREENRQYLDLQTFSVKAHTVNIFCFGHTASVATAQLCPWSLKAAISGVSMNGRGCVPIKLYLWTMKFEFHITFMCLLLLIPLLPQPSECVKTILSSWGYKNRWWAMGPAGPTPGVGQKLETR